MQSKALGNKELEMKFCPECGKEIAVNHYLCDEHGQDTYWDVLQRTLKYHCRVCGKPAANHDKFCRYCGLEH